MRMPPAVHGSASAAGGWDSPLTLAVGGALGFLTVSGLAIWLLPFGLFPQWTVLLHTGVGVLTLIPVGLYLVRHWRQYRQHPLNDVSLVGYVAGIALSVCLLSGLVVTWQALLGTRSDPAWRLVH